LYFVTEFLNGGELFYHLCTDAKFDEPRARFYAAEILLALNHLHQNGIIYRDLKPENVLLDSEGHIRLTDFGLSKLGIVGKDTTSTFCGTPEYLAPEIIVGEGHNRAVDLWSYGVLLYEMLSGVNPFKNGMSRVEKLSKITEHDVPMLACFSTEATDLLRKLLDRNPNTRITASEVQKHPFFAGMDWTRLYHRQIKPPFIPAVNSD
jgi:serine/threonine protein kinase